MVGTRDVNSHATRALSTKSASLMIKTSTSNTELILLQVCKNGWTVNVKRDARYLCNNNKNEIRCLSRASNNTLEILPLNMACNSRTSSLRNYLESQATMKHYGGTHGTRSIKPENSNNSTRRNGRGREPSRTNNNYLQSSSLERTVTIILRQSNIMAIPEV